MKSPVATLRIAALATAVCLSMIQGAQAVVINVNSTTPGFQATGIFVTAGDQIDISATGTINWGCPTCISDTDGVNPANTTVWGFPTGPLFLVPGSRAFSLVGRIDAATLVLEGAPGVGPGFVGSSYSQQANATGQLYLAINDDAYGDNSGSFTASVTITSVPEPLTLAIVGAGLLGVAARRRRR